MAAEMRRAAELLRTVGLPKGEREQTRAQVLIAAARGGSIDAIREVHTTAVRATNEFYGAQSQFVRLMARSIVLEVTGCCAAHLARALRLDHSTIFHGKKRVLNKEDGVTLRKLCEWTVEALTRDLAGQLTDRQVIGALQREIEELRTRVAILENEVRGGRAGEAP